MCAEVKEEKGRKVIIKKDGKVTEEIIETPEQKAAREEKERLELIQRVAEEVHPGNWHYGPMEPMLAMTYGKTHYERRHCECDYCNGKDGTECTHPASKTCYRLLIRFPETVIRNRNGREHPIHEFFIAIPFTADHKKTLNTSLCSYRTKVTTKEYAYGYFHSHSTSADWNCGHPQNYFRWRSCCLGGQTELTDLMFDLYDKGLQEKTLHELLVTLYIYASWESINGGPYMLMKDIRYPEAEGSRNRTNIPFDRIRQYFFRNELPNMEVKPEITGELQDLAISNVDASIGSAAKRVLLNNTRDNDGYNILPWIGNINESGGFTPLQSTERENSAKGPDFYKAVIELAEKELQPVMRQFLNLGPDSDLKYELIWDDEGLGDVPSEPTQADIENAVPHPDIVIDLTRRTLDTFKKFKLKYKTYQRYGKKEE
jgi:hypothetical protein